MYFEQAGKADEIFGNGWSMVCSQWRKMNLLHSYAALSQDCVRHWGRRNAGGGRSNTVIECKKLVFIGQHLDKD